MQIVGYCSWCTWCIVGNESLDARSTTHQIDSSVDVVFRFKLFTPKMLSTRAWVRSNIGHWSPHQLARDDQAQDHFAWRSDVHDFQSIVTEQRNFLARWRLGTPFNILSSQLRFERMHPWFVNRQNAIEVCLASISQKQQMGGGKKNTLGCLVIVGHLWNPLCTNLFFALRCVIPVVLVQ